MIAVVSCAYLAAVFLAADAVRRDEPALAAEFRRRALVAGAVAGVLAAVAGLIVLRSDARGLFDGLVGGDGLAALIVSALAGIVTVLALVWRGRSELARYGVGGRGGRRRRRLGARAGAGDPPRADGRPGGGAARHARRRRSWRSSPAGRSSSRRSRCCSGSCSAGGSATAPRSPPRRAPGSCSRPRAEGLRGRAALACAVVGFGFLTVADAGWAHAIGVVALLSAICLGFMAAVPALLPE